MQHYQLHIKNVVCQRCIATVEQILSSEKIPFSKVDLGYAYLDRPLSSDELKKLRSAFEKVGFKILEGRNQKIANNVKSVIIEEVYSDFSDRKLSDFLAARIPYDYSHLTGIFSETEDQTIQQYYHSVKMERAKELLDYDELSITEIAEKLGFSTPAYFSTAFKNFTGTTPSQFRNLPKKSRNDLDKI